MSEELTLEDIDEVEDACRDILSKTPRWRAILDAARAHLSRPVVGDEQMRDRLSYAEGLIEHMKSPYAMESRSELKMAEALLTMSEQLAAEQEKVKALQPYKDAYEAGQDMWLGTQRKEHGHAQACFPGSFEHTARWAGVAKGGKCEAVRVCKLVEGDG